MVIFPIRILASDSHSPAILDFFLSADLTICSISAFPHWEILIILLSQFSLTFLPSNSKGDVSFHCTAYSYCYVDCGGFCDNLRNA